MMPVFLKYELFDDALVNAREKVIRQQLREIQRETVWPTQKAANAADKEKPSLLEWKNYQLKNKNEANIAAKLRTEQRQHWRALAAAEQKAAEQKVCRAEAC